MIADAVIPVLQEWIGKTPLVAGVVDGGSNMIKAIDLMKNETFIELEGQRYRLFYQFYLSLMMLLFATNIL